MSAQDLIDAYLEYLRLIGRSPYTTYEWGLILRRADRELPIGLDYAGDQELLAWLGRDDWSSATRSAYDACLRSFYRWAIRGEDSPLTLDPMAEIEPPHKDRSLPRPCSDAELHTIITASRDPYAVWFRLAAFDAARCIEISRLDREHVTQQSMRLYGKGGKTRVVPTHELVWEVVRDLPPGPIARNRAGQRLNPRYLSRNSWNYLQQLAPGVSMHRLRHWCLSQIQRRTRNLRVTQEIAGHANPGTTAGYTMVDDEQRSAAIRGIRLPGDRSDAAEVPDVPPPH